MDEANGVGSDGCKLFHVELAFGFAGEGTCDKVLRS